MEYPPHTNSQPLSAEESLRVARAVERGESLQTPEGKLAVDRIVKKYKQTMDTNTTATTPPEGIDYRAEAVKLFMRAGGKHLAQMPNGKMVSIGSEMFVIGIEDALRSFASKIQRETREKIAGHFKAESDMAFSLSNGAKRIAHLDRTQDERESTERLIKSERAKAILNRDVENTIRNLSLPPTTGDKL